MSSKWSGNMDTADMPLSWEHFGSAPLEQISLQLDFQQRRLDRMHAHMESTLETTQQTDVLSNSILATGLFCASTTLTCQSGNTLIPGSRQYSIRTHKPAASLLS